jgi:hypothetical protein
VVKIGGGTVTGRWINRNNGGKVRVRILNCWGGIVPVRLKGVRGQRRSNGGRRGDGGAASATSGPARGDGQLKPIVEETGDDETSPIQKR